MIGIGQKNKSGHLMTKFAGQSDLLLMGPMYLVALKSSEFDGKVSADIIFIFCNIKQFGLTDHATLGFYFSLSVLGSISDKFGSTSLRSYSSFQAR